MKCGRPLTYVSLPSENVSGRVKLNLRDAGQGSESVSLLHKVTLERHSLWVVVPPSATSCSFRLPSIYTAIIQLELVDLRAPLILNSRRLRTLTSTAVTPSVFVRLMAPSTAAADPYTGKLTLSSCAKRRRLTFPPLDCFTKSPTGLGAGRFSARRCSYSCGSAE